MRAAFPDLNVTVDRLVQTETDIAIAYTFHGTHHGEFNGIAPTGRPINARGMQIARFESGKNVERWGSSDELGILLKLGAKVSPGWRQPFCFPSFLTRGLPAIHADLGSGV